MNPFLDNIGADVRVSVFIDRESAMILGAVITLAIILGVFVGVTLAKKI